VPTPVLTDMRFVMLSAHAPAHSCGIALGGQALCWGLNAYGQVGDGSDSTRLTPTPVADERRFQSISVGFYHTCGVTADGRVLCWGSGQAGQLGTGETDDRLVPTAGSSDPAEAGPRPFSAAKAALNDARLTGSGWPRTRFSGIHY